MYDGIIFDQDGVLLDSGINKFHWMDQIRIDEARKDGIELEKSDVKKLVKSSSHETVEKLLQQNGMTWDQLKNIEQKKESWKTRFTCFMFLRCGLWTMTSRKT